MNLPLVTITRIEAAEITGERARIVGRNARSDVHGQIVREPVARLHTDVGVIGWGWCAAEPEEAQPLVGKRLDQVFDLQKGTADPFLKFDLPLWDLVGRLLDKPVHTLLGDQGPEWLPVYDGSIYMDDLDPMTAQDRGLEPLLEGIRQGLSAGFRAFKLKLGRGFRWMEKRAGFERDVEVLYAVRDLTGPDVRLMIDTNNGYTPREARQLMREAGACDIFWFEEPFPEDVAESVSFKRFLREGGWHTLLADGEGTHPDTEGPFTEVLLAGGVDVVQFDFRGYPFSKWVQYMPFVIRADALAAPHNWHSVLLNYYGPQFGRGLPRFAMGETDPIHNPAVLADGYQLVDGLLRVPEKAGFGLELDLSLFRKAQTESSSWTHP
jgi:D-galactarolactone cycloisomerase